MTKDEGTGGGREGKWQPREGPARWTSGTGTVTGTAMTGIQ
jgi:hypothetical protein